MPNFFLKIRIAPKRANSISKSKESNKYKFYDNIIMLFS